MDPLIFTGIIVCIIAISLRYIALVKAWAARQTSHHAGPEKTNPTLREELWDKFPQFIFQIVACAGVVLTLARNYTSIQATTQANRISASNETLRHLHDQGWGKFNNWRYSLPTDANSNQISQLLVLATNNMAETARAILVVFEEASISISSGHADEPVLYYTIKNNLCWCKTNLMPYIKTIRETKGRGGSYLVEFENLANAWANEQSLCSHKRKFQGTDYTQWKESKFHDELLLAVGLWGALLLAATAATTISRLTTRKDRTAPPPTTPQNPAQPPPQR